MARFGYFHYTAIPIHFDPVAGFDNRKRVLIEIRDRGGARDHRAECDLRSHLIKDHRLRRAPGEPRKVKCGRPPRGALRSWKHQYLIFKTHAAKFVVRLDDDTGHRVDSTPSGNRLPGYERFSFRASADDFRMGWNRPDDR